MKCQPARQARRARSTAEITPRLSPDTLGLSPGDAALFARFGFGPAVAPEHRLIHRAFERHAARDPQAIAARHGGAQITYGELDRRANRLARRLIAEGVRPGDNVALFVRRSIPMLVGLLGALKAGASYVPQDARVAPRPQLAHIIEGASTRVILTLGELRDRVPVPAGHVCIELDGPEAPTTAADAQAPVVAADPAHACFILFTSGTTGRPNGVQVTHQNVCNIIMTAPGDLGIAPGMVVSQLLSISFDMAAWEILGALGHGATLLIRGRSIQAAAEQAHVIIATPSILGTVDPARCPLARVVAVAGEPCPRPLADAWAARCTFYNACGPTEVTIVNTMQPHRPANLRLTIGRPTPNNTVYVLDADLKPLPIGEIGEMWAGGICVTAGYLKNPELTAERYRPDPFLGGDHMMFRTRDLGRWTPDGELEHFGRTDDQVKVRGFRVELDSVSGALESVDDCQQAVTLKLDERDLVAFVRPATVDVEAARQAVAERLPYYCVPAFVIALDALPRTDRGKLDKRALARQAAEHAARLGAEEAVSCAA